MILPTNLEQKLWQSSRNVVKFKIFTKCPLKSYITALYLCNYEKWHMWVDIFMELPSYSLLRALNSDSVVKATKKTQKTLKKLTRKN